MDYLYRRRDGVLGLIMIMTIGFTIINYQSNMTGNHNPHLLNHVCLERILFWAIERFSSKMVVSAYHQLLSEFKSLGRFSYH